MEIVFASNNSHKLEEVNFIAKNFGVTFVKPQEGFDPVENGKTFEENALIKAKAAQELGGGRYFLADDSGLCVECLGGAPGLHSARYADGQLASIEKLLNEMGDVSRDKRSAKFVCSMVLLDESGNVLYKSFGQREGRIGLSATGHNGFGYDPIFVLDDGRTMAQLLDHEKNLISHRARALIDVLVWMKINRESLAAAAS